MSLPQFKKKVLIVSDYFIPHWTGIVKSLANLTFKLNKKINFTILTVRHKKQLKNHEIINQVKIVRENPFFSLSRAKISLSLVYRFFTIIDQYDVVLFNVPLSTILPLSLIAKLKKKKILIFYQGDLILPKGFFNMVIEKVFDFSTFLGCFLSDKVSTYTSDYAKNSRILKHYQRKFTPLIPPLNLKKITDQKVANVSNFKKLSSLKKEGKIIFGFAGRFVEEKGFDILFKAIPLVIKNNKNIHFVYAGETKIEYEKTFEKLKKNINKIKDHLTFLGLLKNKQMCEFYQLIDFIVIPSRSDCFNLVQAEAMSFKKPSIVSDIPGARFLVGKTGFGLIFKKEDYHDLAQKIILAVKIKRKLLSNYPKVLKILDDEKNTQKFRKFIEL